MQKGVTLFKLYFDYLVRNGVLEYLPYPYTVESWSVEDDKLKIVTADRVYRGIIIECSADGLWVYKRSRQVATDNIYAWFRGRVQSVRGDLRCESPEEWEIISRIVMGLLPTLQRLLEDGSIYKHVLEENVIRKWNVTEDEHKSTIARVNRFAKDMAELYGIRVRLHEYDYFSYEHFMDGVTCRLEFANDGECDIKASEDKAVVVSGEDWFDERPMCKKALIQMLRTRSYARVQRRMMEEESGNVLTKGGRRF